MVVWWIGVPSNYGLGAMTPADQGLTMTGNTIMIQWHTLRSRPMLGSGFVVTAAHVIVQIVTQIGAQVLQRGVLALLCSYQPILSTVATLWPGAHHGRLEVAGGAEDSVPASPSVSFWERIRHTIHHHLHRHGGVHRQALGWDVGPGRRARQPHLVIVVRVPWRLTSEAEGLGIRGQLFFTEVEVWLGSIPFWAGPGQEGRPRRWAQCQAGYQEQQLAGHDGHCGSPPSKDKRALQ